MVEEGKNPYNCIMLVALSSGYVCAFLSRVKRLRFFRRNEILCEIELDTFSR